MKLFDLFTPQSRPLPGETQVLNHAGGYVYETDPWTALDRFLILGTTEGTYYVAPRPLTQEAAKNAIELLRADGARFVARVAEVSETGRAPRNDPAVFALALAAGLGDEATRRAAAAALPRVCRTGTHLFEFVRTVDGLRGWGRALRRAVADWYARLEPDALELQLTKYASREGWSHRDVLRLSHAVPPTPAHRELYGWSVGKVAAPEGARRIEAMARLNAAENAAEAAAIVAETRVPRELVPGRWLAEPEVWDALLPSMPLGALARNLGTLSRVGVLTPGSEAAALVVRRFGDAEAIRRARLHPVAILVALAVYGQGRGVRSAGTWTPVPEVTAALDGAFYAAFSGLPETSARTLVALDVSGSMGSPASGAPALSCAQGAAAMAMALLRTSARAEVMAFADAFRPLRWDRSTRLDAAVRETAAMTFGRTDCSLPMRWARERGREFDLFVVITDNETWWGPEHPMAALRRYREAFGPARLAVIAMSATPFTIADPLDPGTLDVCGFDATVPEVVGEFAKSR